MSNYASVEMGAEIVDASSGHNDYNNSGGGSSSSPPSSGPSNLLLDRDDLLWMAGGDAPQHVTVRIKANHPPIRYVGWHVWQDYVTNPKTVIVSSAEGFSKHHSGGSSSSAPLLNNLVLECSALPGAGTQLWELPTPIPTEHCYVQFKIASTFAPGPTYMNKLVLFSTHPGSGFQTRGANTNNNSNAHNTTTASSLLEVSNAHSNIPTNHNYSTASHMGGGGGGGGHTGYTPGPINTTAKGRPDHSYYSGSSPLTVGNNSTMYGGNANAAALNNTTGGGGQRAGSVQMSDLLAGLDDDIKRLHPIKTISPTKRPNPNGRSISPSVMLPEMEEFANFAETNNQFNPNPNPSASNSQSHYHQSAPSAASLPLAPVVPQVQYVQIPPPPPDPSAQEALMRVSALERAVEMLAKAVERQSSDIGDMKRLLQEKQHDREYADRTQRELMVLEARNAAKEEVGHHLNTSMRNNNTNPNNVSTGNANGNGASTSTTTTTAVVGHHNSNSNNSALQLIEFPETALKNYIEDVLAPRLSKHAKRTEARTIQQIDDHMHVLLKEIGAVVDERVERHLHKIMRDGSRHPYAKALQGMHSQQQQSVNMMPPPHHRDPHPHHSSGAAQQQHSSGYGVYEEIYGHGGSRARSGASRSAMQQRY